LCIAAAPSFGLLLVSRAIQGIGAGGIASVASAVIGDVFTSTLGWRWLFLLNIPVALVVRSLGARSLPRQPMRRGCPHESAPTASRKPCSSGRSMTAW